jgi:hypothetical protein
MTETRSPLARALGVAEDEYAKRSRTEYEGAADRLAEAISNHDWPAAQAYALTMIAVRMPTEPISVMHYGS